MRNDGRESDNVEDRRGGDGGGSSGGGGLLGLIPSLFSGKGIIGIVVAIAGAYFLGIDPRTILSLFTAVGTSNTEMTTTTRPIPKDDPQAKFVSVVLADTEDVWRKLFSEAGKTYRDPKLVLFRGSTPTACGKGKSAMGPFYCPGDQKVYIDLSFYEEMRSRYQAPGDFAQAYVIGHEVGHHVQNMLGTMNKVRRQQDGQPEAAANALSVKLELQADCYAGVWAHHADKTRKIIESGDIEEALRAAAAIGDDALQKQSGGAIVPESFTHGSSADRMRWFKRGMETGELEQCNTF